VLKASTMRADFIPLDKKAKPLHFDCLFEKEKYPEDVTEKDIELNAAPATRRHMLDFLAAIEQRSRPVADIEQGHISTASCILANVAMQVGRTLGVRSAPAGDCGRPRSFAAPGPRLPRAVEAAGDRVRSAPATVRRRRGWAGRRG
jgi:hypothetical protein